MKTRARPLGERIFWFAAIWLASVAAIAIVAEALRWALKP